MSVKVLTGETSDCCKPKMTWVAWLAVILAVGPFVIKRIILLGDYEDYVVWLTIDYVARCVSLLGVALAFRSGLIEPLEFRAGWFVSAVVLAGLLSTELAEQTFIYPILRDNLNYLRLSSMPQIANANVRAADLVFGLLLVAVSEELVFRRMMFSILGPKGFVSVIFWSALIFALIHLTSGMADAINAFISGVLLGSAFWITRRVSLCVVSHYLINLKIFGSF
jgi:membrane protease YdiL (CAAX protease family)